MTDAVAGPDGRLRCPWGISVPEYVAYHDQEWGRPLHGDQAIYERLCLEAFQSGLSWLTILRKRENFRAAFAGFDPAAVAKFGDDDVQRLLADPGIVRNRAKINAAIVNARAALDIAGGLSALVWNFAGEPGPAPVTTADVPAQTRFWGAVLGRPPTEGLSPEHAVLLPAEATGAPQLCQTRWAGVLSFSPPPWARRKERRRRGGRSSGGA